MQGHTGCVNPVTMTRDKKYIISGSKDMTVRVWNLLQKTQEAVFKGHTSCIKSVAVTSDNKYIISVSGDPYNQSSDNTTRVWKF